MADHSDSLVQNPGKESEPEKQPKERTTLLIGDSMISRIPGKDLGKAVGHRVIVKPFSGATTMAMNHYLKPNLESSPNEVILHIGTNDLKTREPKAVAESIVDLARQIEGTCDTTVTLSELVCRKDKLDQAVKTANKHLKKFCHQNGWKLIHHENISHSGLNKGGLHLNFKGSRQRLNTLTASPTIRMNNTQVSQVSATKSLGVIIDDKLDWHSHIEKLTKKIASGIGALKRIRHLIPASTLHLIYQALVKPHFDYCDIVWGSCGKTLRDKLQKLQNRAARVLTFSNYDADATELLEFLGWKNLARQQEIHKATMMFRCLHGLAPRYLYSKFTWRDSAYDLRDSENKLNVPLPRTNYYRKSFSYNGATLWNSLPRDIRNTESLGLFKPNCANFRSRGGVTDVPKDFYNSDSHDEGKCSGCKERKSPKAQTTRRVSHCALSSEKRVLRKTFGPS
ncbi:hypothetical protein AWC38_SpisGene14594 [Stylophora pistillata]|uniref:SGNH hydrolase-type esterase domain-containing protein n=1 Tax=Stylophora pistillata TaxID=50429 RepID=A0A2B4RWK0_STYPI|nr:hypothetical protein AWC38_SpisGene14594 [Stylophora pistillata]